MPANTQSMIIHAGTRAISYCCSGLPTCSLASAMIFAGGGRSQKRLSGWRPWCRWGRFCRAAFQRLENRIVKGARARAPGGAGGALRVASRSRGGPALLRAVRMSRGVLYVEGGRQ